MPTKNQFLTDIRKKFSKKKRSTLLEGNPQRKGTCIRISIMSPRKPNSAKRKVVRSQIWNGKKAWIYIPGEGGHKLQMFSNILIRGGRVQDLPVQYKAIRNKYDLSSVEKRISARSKYGCKLPKDLLKNKQWKKTKLKKRY